MGGLSKKSFQFSKLSKEQNKPVLIVDGGSLLFKRNPLLTNQEQQAKITATGIVKAYNIIGYDAVGISSQDLAAGVDFLIQITNESNFTWLSANIINTKSGLPLFKPAISRQIGNIKVGIIGLTDQIHSNIKLLGTETTIKPWQDTLPKLLVELRKDHNFIILLTSLPDKDCREIARLFPAVNLIIHANNNNSNKFPIKLSDTTLMTSTGKKGKYIGAMNVKWYPESSWQKGNDAILENMKKERDNLKQQLNQMKKPIARKKHILSMKNRLRTVESTIKQIEGRTPTSSYINRFMAIEKSMPDHAPVQKIVTDTNLLINKINRESSAIINNDKWQGNTFAGWRKCQKCHDRQIKKWQGTRHASSFRTLVERNQQFNPDCLPCHVTGATPNNPASAIGMPSVLQMVSCESCHGPGILHSKNPGSHKTLPVTEKTCLNCHVPEHDDSFNFIRDLRKLKCLS